MQPLGRATSVHRSRQPRTCLACGEVIPAQATKCSHCGTPQSRKRYIDSGLVQLAALATVAGTIVATWPFIRPLIYEPDSEVSLGIPLVTNHADFDIRLVNSGDRDASLLSAQVELMDSRSATAEGKIEIDADDGVPISLIGANRQYDLFGVMRTSFASVKKFVSDHAHTINKCSVVLDVANFTSGVKTISRDFSCNVFVKALEEQNTPPG